MTTQAAVAPAGADVFLTNVEQHMVELVGRRPGVAATAAADAIAAGGKRLRPLMVFAARPIGSDADQPIVRAAAAIELVHTASLVHDDLLDAAELRRGQPTVAHRHGPTVATAVGDLLFSLAFATLVECRSLAGDHLTLSAVDALAGTARMLAEGEALQAAQHRDLTLTQAAYLTRCERKTGVLFGAALRLGALLAGAASDDVDLLDRYGTRIGIAFQMADDVLDCLPQAAYSTIGKHTGTDVRDGTVTMPLLLAARADSRVATELARELPDVELVLQLVAATDAVERASGCARQLAVDALEMLDDLRGDFDVPLLAAIADRAATDARCSIDRHDAGGDIVDAGGGR